MLNKIINKEDAVILAKALNLDNLDVADLIIGN